MLVPPLCWSCAGLARRREPVCAECRRRLPRLAPEPVVVAGVRVWAPAAYEGPARDLVRALKFRGATRVAEFMAAQVVATAPPELLAGPLVPVPLHPKRVRSRGFNQAAVLASAIAARANLEVKHCLGRSGAGRTQVGRAWAERREGPAGEIETVEDVPVRVVLVDDVVTTGATLRASAAALTDAGCREVVAVTFARTRGR